MPYLPEYMVKQYVAVVQNKRGVKFAVFKTGSEKHYLFSCVKDGVFTGLQFPVLKKDLNPEIKRALNHGWGNAEI